MANTTFQWTYPAKDVLAVLRPDPSDEQLRVLLNKHRNELTLGKSNFGRRGRPVYAVQCAADVERILQAVNVPSKATRRRKDKGYGLMAGLATPLFKHGAA